MVNSRKFFPGSSSLFLVYILCFSVCSFSYGAPVADARVIRTNAIQGPEPILHLQNEDLRTALDTHGIISKSGVVKVSFDPAVSESTYRITVNIPENLALRSDKLRVQFRLRLDGWRSYRYVGYGWRYPDREFSYVANPHPDQGNWFTDQLDPDGYEAHVARYRPKPNSPGNFEIYIKGMAGEHGAVVEIDSVMLFESTPAALMVSGETIDFGKDCLNNNCLALSLAREGLSENNELREALRNYVVGLFDDETNKNGADLYLDTGQVLLRGVPVVSGDWRQKMPPLNDYTTTHRYLWHALWMPRAHLARYIETGDSKYLDAAIDLIDEWLILNIESNSKDPKYAWYDHGVAERALTLTLAYVEAVSSGSDSETLGRLASSIYRHQELLSSDWFYSRNQPFRWHNHAIFQDMALMISSELIQFDRSQDWSRLAQYRSVLQFQELVSSEGVSVENSMGYHVAEAGLCHDVTEWFRLISTDHALGQADKLNGICGAMSLFSDAMTWPDGRLPAFGDSHFNLNAAAAEKYTGKLDYSEYMEFYPQSGYFVARGDAGEWQLSFIAPSKSITHKHQDNLNIILWAYGVAWIVDPGYYTYQMEDPVTKYARGPASHNFLHYGYADQSIDPGSAEIWLERSGDSFRVSGRTTALVEAVGTRRIEGGLSKNNLKISDTLSSSNGDYGSRNFILQFGDGVDASMNNGRVRLRYPGVISELELSSDLFDRYCRVIDAESDREVAGPGWVYPSFGVMVRADALLCNGLPEHFEWNIEMLKK